MRLQPRLSAFVLKIIKIKVASVASRNIAIYQIKSRQNRYAVLEITPNIHIHKIYLFIIQED